MPTNFNPTFINQINDAVQKAVAAKAPYLIARVTHVVLGPYYVGTTTNDPYYNNPTDIGSITVQLIQGVQDRTLQSGGNPVIKPAHSSIKHMPVEGELVLLIPGPSTKLNESRGLQDYYYTAPFNIWNASHHNAFPDLGDVSDYANSTEKKYNTPGLRDQPTNLSVNQSASFPLGPAFPEKAHLKNLLLFVGDVTIEGRWGNSIRLGSTTEQKGLNTWSSTGEPGTPITIIRNGQGRSIDETAWIPTVEDINRDASSIYLTNGQKIIINDIQNSFSLASLGITLESNYANAIALQQALTSYDSISPSDQDKYVSQNV